MITKYSELLMRLATGRNLIILFILFILTTSVIFPLMSSLIEDPGGELEKIDTKLNYTSAELYKIIDAYGAQGRQVYALSHLTADVVIKKT